MESNRSILKTMGKMKRSRGIFPLSLRCFILSLLILNFVMVPAYAKESEESGLQFLSSELDSEPVYFEIQDARSESGAEKEGTAETFEPTPQPSFKEVLMLLKNIQTELLALKNQTTEENQELKSQMRSLCNQQKEKEGSKSPQIPNQTTSGPDKSKETGPKIHLDAPAPSGLCDPVFYPLANFNGWPYTPPTGAWKTRCVDLEGTARMSSSLKTGGHCLLLCPEKNCKSKSLGPFSVPCRQINGSTRAVSQLDGSGYATIESFRQC